MTMEMCIFICFIIAGILLLSVVRIQQTKTQIGDEGRQTVWSEGVRIFAGGILLFAGSGTEIIYRRILQKSNIDVDIIFYIIFGVGLLLGGLGFIILKRIKREQETEPVITTLSDCRIVNLNSRWSRSDMLTGVSAERRQNMFTILGRDRKMVEQALKTGKKQMVIRYYQHSGRIQDITWMRKN